MDVEIRNQHLRMKTIVLLFTFIISIQYGCKKENPVNTIPDNQIVSIKTPVNNAFILDSVTVEINVREDKHIIRVELYIDHEIDSSRIFTSPPYKYVWYTKTLNDGSQHILEVKAYDRNGVVWNSPIVIVYVYKFQPSNLSVKLLNDTVALLSWKDNCSLETGFDIFGSINDSNFSFIKAVDSNITSTKIDGFYYSSNVYYFKVRAKTTSTFSSFSNTDSAKIVLQNPNNLTAVFTTDTSVFLSWQYYTTFESGFEIEQSIDAINFSKTQTVGKDYRSAIVIGEFLSINTYYFRIRAISKLNFSNYSISGSVKVNIPPPTNLSVAPISWNEIKLQWSDNCNYELGFLIERQTNDESFLEVGRVDSNVTFYQDENLDTSNLYHYRVRTFTRLNVSDIATTIKIVYKIDTKPKRTITGHSSSVYSVDCSPDGSRIASGSADGTVKLWNLNNGILLRTLHGHSTIVRSVAFSPDGQKLISGSDDKTVKLWDVNYGILLKSLIGHNSGVNTVTYSPDGLRIISGGNDDKLIKVWTSEGILIKNISGHTGAITSLVYSKNGSFFASSSYDKTIKIWKADDGTLIRNLIGHTDLIFSISLSPDGNYLASGSQDRYVFYWRVSDGIAIKYFSGFSYPIETVAISPDGLILATGESHIKLWRISDGQLLTTLIGDSRGEGINSITFSPDGKYLISGDNLKTIKIWFIENQWVTSP